MRSRWSKTATSRSHQGGSTQLPNPQLKTFRSHCGNRRFFDFFRQNCSSRHRWTADVTDVTQEIRVMAGSAGSGQVSGGAGKPSF